MNKNIVVFVPVVILAVSIAFFVGRYTAPPTPPSMPTPLSTDIPLYQEITTIKDRLTVVITEPGFTNPVPKCDFYEVRQQQSDEYFQTTINYEVFQNGKGVHGDIEAFVEIYNTEDPNDNDYTIEISRNCWFELTVYYEGRQIVRLPSVHSNTLSLGYFTTTVPL